MATIYQSVKNLTLYIIYAVLVINLVSNTNGKKLIVTEDDDGDVKEGCQELLDNFAATVGLFTFCTIRHARPIKICEQCVDTYMNTVTAHDKILKLGDQSGQACKIELINLDRLEVIESTMQNVVDLWDRGKCDHCFSFVDGKLTANLSQDTQDFHNLSVENEACFQLNINETWANGTSLVCDDCRDVYCKMNEFYNKIKKSSGDGDICIDIVDSMNSTRSKWSQTFGCTLHKMELDVTFVVTACVVILVPIVFYIAAKLFSIKAETKLLQQNRLGGQFPNRPSTTDNVSPQLATSSQPSTSAKSWRT